MSALVVYACGVVLLWEGGLWFCHALAWPLWVPVVLWEEVRG